MKNETTAKLEKLQKDRSKITSNDSNVIDTITIKKSVPGSFKEFTIEDLFATTEEAVSICKDHTY